MSEFTNILIKLIKKDISISVVESCTGGLLAKCIIDQPGISKVFSMGLVTYSNKAKIKVLKIPKTTLNKYGAVSKEIALLMVKGLYKISKSELCISTTGITGPSGGTKQKPVGLVFICLHYKNKHYIFKKIFKGNRKTIQKNIIIFCFKQIKKLI